MVLCYFGSNFFSFQDTLAEGMYSIDSDFFPTICAQLIKSMQSLTTGVHFLTMAVHFFYVFIVVLSRHLFDSKIVFV